MAWSSLGTLGATGLKAADQTSIVHTVATTSPSAGDVVVVVVAVDNNATTDGDEGAVSSVVDSAGNTYTKAREFTNSQGAAQAGATCSVWYSTLTTGLTAGSSTITANFTNSTSRDASALSAYAYTITAGNVVSVEATNTRADDGADPGSLNATTANAEFLRVRGIASETSTGTDLIPTTNWTIFAKAATIGGGGAGNMAVRGEFHISTGTGDASDPSFVNTDHASVYVALKETAAAVIARPLLPMKRFMMTGR